MGLLTIYFMRGPLTHAAVTSGLQRAGAGDIKVEVAHATPWSVQLDNLAFKIKAQLNTIGVSARLRSAAKPHPAVALHPVI